MGIAKYCECNYSCFDTEAMNKLMQIYVTWTAKIFAKLDKHNDNVLSNWMVSNVDSREVKYRCSPPDARIC